MFFFQNFTAKNWERTMTVNELTNIFGQKHTLTRFSFNLNSWIVSWNLLDSSRFLPPQKIKIK